MAKAYTFFGPAWNIGRLVGHASVHWSADWATRTPWTFHGEPLPYIAARKIKHEMPNLCMYIGPIAIVIAGRILDE